MARFRLPGGKLEYAVLRTLWALGRGSARDIHARVTEPTGLAYTTVATVLDRLHSKGLVSREKGPRGFQYWPRAPRAAVEGTRLRQTLDWLLTPEAAPAMARLVDAVESIDPELLDALAKEIAKKRKTRRGS